MRESYVLAYWVIAVCVVGIICSWATRIIVEELADRKEAKLREANWRAMERIFGQPNAVINAVAVDMESTGVIGVLTLPPRTYDEVGKDYAYALAESMGFHGYRFPTAVVSGRTQEDRSTGNNL